MTNAASSQASVRRPCSPLWANERISVRLVLRAISLLLVGSLVPAMCSFGANAVAILVQFDAADRSSIVGVRDALQSNVAELIFWIFSDFSNVAPILGLATAWALWFCPALIVRLLIRKVRS